MLAKKAVLKIHILATTLRLVQDVINEQDKDRLVLLFDQQKAFDRVEWNWFFLC